MFDTQHRLTLHGFFLPGAITLGLGGLWLAYLTLTLPNQERPSLPASSTTWSLASDHNACLLLAGFRVDLPEVYRAQLDQADKQWRYHECMVEMGHPRAWLR